MLTHSVMNGTVRLSDCARSRGAIIENLGVSPTSPDRRIKITAGQGGVSRLRRDYRSSSGACQRTVCPPFLKHATGREIVAVQRTAVRVFGRHVSAYALECDCLCASERCKGFSRACREGDGTGLRPNTFLRRKSIGLAYLILARVPHTCLPRDLGSCMAIGFEFSRRTKC